jgi:hypothetical protein
MLTGTGTCGVSNKKVVTVRLDKEIGSSVAILLSQFDKLVDEAVDDIVFITPTSRYITPLDDWLDFGYQIDDGYQKFISLARSYIGRA